MKSRIWVGCVGMLALLGGTLLASHMAPSRTPEALQRPLSAISPEIAGWKMAGAEALTPAQLSATSYVARTYIKNDHQLELLVAFHDSYQAAVNVHTPKNCLPGDGWEIWKTASPSVMLDGRPMVINQYQIYRMGQRMTVLYWFQTRGRVVANEYLAKLMLMRDGLLEHRTSGSFVRIILPNQPELLPDGFRFAEGVMREIQLCFHP